MKYYRVCVSRAVNLSRCGEQWVNNKLFNTYEKALEWLKEYREEQVKIGKAKNYTNVEERWYFDDDNTLVENCYDFRWEYTIKEFEIPQYEII